MAALWSIKGWGDMRPPQLFDNRHRGAATRVGAGTKDGAGTKAGPGTKASAGTKAGAGTKAIPIPAPGHLVSRKPRDRDQ